MSYKVSAVIALCFLSMATNLMADICSICNKEIPDSQKQELCCGHHFHTFCIKNFIRNHANCPQCGVVICFHSKDFKNSAHDLCSEPDFEELKEKFQCQYDHERQMRYGEYREYRKIKIPPKCLFPKDSNNTKDNVDMSD